MINDKPNCNKSSPKSFKKSTINSGFPLLIHRACSALCAHVKNHYTCPKAKRNTNPNPNLHCIHSAIGRLQIFDCAAHTDSYSWGSWQLNTYSWQQLVFYIYSHSLCRHIHFQADFWELANQGFVGFSRAMDYHCACHTHSLTCPPPFCLTNISELHL